MEYTDYKTGETISREQYIKNGLERGELLVKEECGCIVIQDRIADAYIVYCPKHKAAEEMYKACLAALPVIGEGYYANQVKQLVEEAIAKAEGGE